MPRIDGPIRVAPGFRRQNPGADPPATECVVNLLRTQSLVAAALTRGLRANGLTLASFNVLMILRGAATPLCPYEISERLLVTRGTITGVLDTLEKQRYLRRLPHAADRRMLSIEITEDGVALLDTLLPGHFRNERSMLSCLKAGEKETLINLLGKMQTHIAKTNSL